MKLKKTKTGSRILMDGTDGTDFLYL